MKLQMEDEHQAQKVLVSTKVEASNLAGCRALAVLDPHSVPQALRTHPQLVPEAALCRTPTTPTTKVQEVKCPRVVMTQRAWQTAQ